VRPGPLPFSYCPKRSRSLRSTALVLTLCAVAGFCGCYSSMPGNTSLAPIVNGAWTMTFTPTAQSTAATRLAVSFTQNGNTLTGTVTSVSNPSPSCFPVISAQTQFNVTGQVAAQSQSSTNLNVSVAFTSGSSSGTIMGTGSLAYLGTMANGNFSFASGASGCTSGTFTMTQG
jgi:hypothetical protein